MPQTTLTDEQRMRLAELPDDYRMIGVDRSAPLVRNPTGQLMRVQQNGRLTAATITAKRRFARRAEQSRPLTARGKPQTRPLTQADTTAESTARSQREPASTLYLQRLEGTTQAVLATLRRALVENVRPTRGGLAHEAAIAFDLNDDQRALAIIDEIAQTVGISALS